MKVRPHTFGVILFLEGELFYMFSFGIQNCKLHLLEREVPSNLFLMAENFKYFGIMYEIRVQNDQSGHYTFTWVFHLKILDRMTREFLDVYQLCHTGYAFHKFLHVKQCRNQSMRKARHSEKRIG